MAENRFVQKVSGWKQQMRAHYEKVLGDCCGTCVSLGCPISLLRSWLLDWFIARRQTTWGSCRGYLSSSSLRSLCACTCTSIVCHSLRFSSISTLAGRIRQRWSSPSFIYTSGVDLSRRRAVGAHHAILRWRSNFGTSGRLLPIHRGSGAAAVTCSRSAAVGAWLYSIHVHSADRALVRRAAEQVPAEDGARFLLGPVKKAGYRCWQIFGSTSEKLGLALALRVSGAPVFACMVADDDDFRYHFDRDGQLVDRYCAAPEAFEGIPKAERRSWRGEPRRFAGLFDSPDDVTACAELLRFGERRARIRAEYQGLKAAGLLRAEIKAAGSARAREDLSCHWFFDRTHSGLIVQWSDWTLRRGGLYASDCSGVFGPGTARGCGGMAASQCLRGEPQRTLGGVWPRGR